MIRDKFISFTTDTQTKWNGQNPQSCQFTTDHTDSCHLSGKSGSCDSSFQESGFQNVFPHRVCLAVTIMPFTNSNLRHLGGPKHHLNLFKFSFYLVFMLLVCQSLHFLLFYCSFHSYTILFCAFTLLNLWYVILRNSLDLEKQYQIKMHYYLLDLDTAHLTLR